MRKLHSRQSLGGETQCGSGSTVKDNISGLQSDVAVDVDTDAGAGLETTVTSGGTIFDRGIVEVGTGNDDANGAHNVGEGRQSGSAWEDVTTVGVGVGGAGDLGVVVLDNGGGQQEKGCAGISNTANGGLVRGCANQVARGTELPEALRGGHRGVGNGASVLGGVGVAEVISTSYFLKSVNGLPGRGILGRARRTYAGRASS